MSAQDTTATIASGEQAGRSQMSERHMLIDGQLVGAQHTYPSINPASGDVLGYAPNADVVDAERAIAAARAAFDTTDWSTNVELRIRCMEQLHSALVEHSDELRALTIAEVGATKALTESAQLDDPIRIVGYYANLLKTYEMSEDLGEIESRGGQRHHRWVEKEAAGVVAAIIAYNYPNQLALAKLGPSLAAGCTVILKAAPDTPLTTLALGEVIAKHTDIPRRRHQRDQLHRPRGRCRTDHQPRRRRRDLHRVDGNRAQDHGGGQRHHQEGLSGARRQVGHDRARRRRLHQLRDDGGVHDLLARRPGVRDHDAAAGSPRAHHDEIVELVKNFMGMVRYGDPADPSTYMGPLINDTQRDKVDGMVQRAVAPARPWSPAARRWTAPASSMSHVDHRRRP